MKKKNTKTTTIQYTYQIQHINTQLMTKISNSFQNFNKT